MFKMATSLFLSPQTHPIDHVFRTKLATIDDLKCIVNDFAENMDPDLIRKVNSSARLRFEKLRHELGGHFELLILRCFCGYFLVIFDKFNVRKQKLY